jgi:CubicO group peptidase (beta-lactamase class C family)
MKVVDVQLFEGPGGSPMERCRVVLRETEGDRRIDLWFHRVVAEWTASALRGVEIPWASSTYHASMEHLRMTGERITGVLLQSLADGTLRGVVEIEGSGHSRRVGGRPADSVTLAVLASAPIYLAPDLLDTLAPASPRDGTDSVEAPELMASAELAIDLFERQDAWDAGMRRASSRPLVEIGLVGQGQGSAWRSDALPSPLAERLDTEVARIIEEHRLVSLAIGLVWRGSLAYFRSIGVRDASSLVPVTEHTVFPMMSITKTLVALAVMQLWERRLFELDDPIDRYVKTIAIRRKDSNSVPVTIRRALMHTDGIADQGQVQMLPRDQPLPAITELYRDGMVAAGRTDEPWSYRQEGYVLLGELVQHLTGQSIRDYLVEHIFDPLGMSETDFQSGPRLGWDRAIGYERDLVGVYAVPTPPLWVALPATGAAYSTVHDLGRYVAALSGQMPPHVLAPETLAAMFEPLVVVPVRWPAHFGLGFNIRPVDGAAAVGHNGGTMGCMTVVWGVPGRDIGIVMCTNTSGAPGLEREPPENLLPLTLAYS